MTALPSTVTRALLVSSMSGPQTISLEAWPALRRTQGADAGQDFLHVEGLGDVVVGAGVEARHLVAPAIAGGKDEDRHLAPGAPPFLENADAIHDGKADVEDDGIVRLGVAEKVAFLAVLGRVDRIAGVGECGHQLPVQVRVILNHQQSHAEPLSCSRTKRMPFTRPGPGRCAHRRGRGSPARRRASSQHTWGWRPSKA